MIVPARLTVWAVTGAVPGRWGSATALFAGTAAGAATFIGLQVLWRAPELAWLAGGLGRRGRGTVEPA